jgi:hypothetical protein
MCHPSPLDLCIQKKKLGTQLCKHVQPYAPMPHHVPPMSCPPPWLHACHLSGFPPSYLPFAPVTCSPPFHLFSFFFCVTCLFSRKIFYMWLFPFGNILVPKQEQWELWDDGLITTTSSSIVYRLMEFLIFLVSDYKGFHHTKGCLIWVMFAKVISI